MAFSKSIFASVLFSLLALHLVHGVEPKEMVRDSEAYVTPDKPLFDCGGACQARCGGLSSRPRLCKRACGTCCYRCKCVPAGTSGNLDSCPCYATMTTRDNKRNCP